MADLEFRGDALPLSEITEVYVERYLPGGVYGLRIYNLPEIKVVAPADLPDEAAGVARLLAQQIVLAGLSAKAAGNKVTIEGPQATTLGIRIRATPNCYVQNLRLGVSPTAKQIKVTLPEGATGGTWSLTFNFGAGAETATLNADGDIGAMETAIEALASVASGEATVSMLSESPFSYLISIGGSQLGKNWTVSADGAGLVGTAKVEIETTQIPASFAVCVQMINAHILPNYNGGRQMALKFSRGGTTSSAVFYEGATLTALKAACRAAIEQLPNVGTVDVNIAISGIDLVVVVRWIALGSQDPISCFSYDVNHPNAIGNPTYYDAATTRVIRQSGDNQNEILLIKAGIEGNVVNGSPTAQPTYYSVTQGATSWTVNHSYTSTAANLVTEWESGLGAGNVAIYSGAKYRNIYVLEFKSALGNSNQEPVTMASPGQRSITTIIEGSPFLNEIHRIVIHADAGTFPLSADNGTNYTAGLAWNLSAASLQTALQALTAIGSGNCLVTGAGTPADPFFVEYIGALASTDVTLLKVGTHSLVGGYDPGVVTSISPEQGVYQVDQIWLDPNLNGGYLMPIRDNLFGNRVAWNGDAAAWEAAIEAIPSSSCTVTGSGKPFLVTWATYGPKNFDLNQDNATVSVSSLLRLVRVRESTGPNYFNQAKNWSGEMVPSSGDRIILRDGRQSINEGLTQRCNFTVDTGTGDLILGTDVTNSGDFVGGQGVYLSTEGAFPSATLSGSPLTIHDDVMYYVTGIDKLSRRLQLSTTQGGAGIEFTTQGTGVHTVEVVLLDYQHHKTFSGLIGLPRRSNGRLEEKQRWLEIASQNVDISLGDQGTGSALQNLSLGKRLSKVNQYGSGASQPNGEYSTNLRASNEGTDIWIGGGNLAISPVDMNGESSVVGDIEVNQASILIGKCDIGSFRGVNAVIESPYGYTMRGTHRSQR